LQFYAKQGIVHLYTASDLPRNNNCSDPARKPNEGIISQWLTKTAKPYCDWIGFIDPDEYVVPLQPNITLSSITSTTVTKPETQIESTHSSLSDMGLIRLQWLVVGSSNIYYQQPLARIDTFRCGYWHSTLKTIARSDVISDWTFSHVPWIKGTFPLTKYRGAEMSINSSYESKEVFPGCKIPKIGFAIRHLPYTSLEEFSKVRGRRVFTSDGHKCNDSETPVTRSKGWFNANYLCTDCSRYGEDSVLRAIRKAYDGLSRYDGAPNVAEGTIKEHIYYGIPFQYPVNHTHQRLRVKIPGYVE
jgi:hypothetical protein